MNPLATPARPAPLARTSSTEGGPPSAAPAASAARSARVAGSFAVLLLVDYSRAGRPWGWARMVLGRRPLRGVPGLRFAKVLGSGHEGGFGLRPSGTRQGLFCVFADEAAARAFAAESPVVAAYRAHARECCIALLRATSCKGAWDGTALQPAGELPAGGPVVALTRASIRPRKLAAFWRQSPPSEASLAAAPGCRLSVGLGEAPLVRQCTVSVWDSIAAMDAYARSGAHLQAIRTAYAGDFFSESMFVRFALLGLQGRWKGCEHGL